MTQDQARLLFSVEDDGTIHLHVGKKLIIPFENLEEWNKFANDMLSMVPEMTENYPHVNG